MKRYAVFAFLAPLLFLACGGDAPPPEKKDAPPPPPEPSTSEIKDEFMKPLGSISAILMGSGQVPPEMLGQVQGELNKVNTKYTGKKNMAAAKSEVADQLEQALKTTEQMQNWAAVMVAADLLAFFEPNNPTIAPAKEQAYKELTRPKLSKPSFATDRQNNVTTVFITVEFPDKGKREDFRVREGEDFAEGRFRLLEIIGRNQGIRVMDVQDGKEFEIMSRERSDTLR